MLLTFSGLLLMAATPVFAATAAASEVDWAALTMGLLGGLALFLFGLDQMSDALQAAAGDGLKLILGKLTRNRFLGATTGAVVTAVLNSSSVTTVLVVGFITAGVMTFSQSVAVIMGANIGSTFTAQIIAFNVTKYALGMIALGFAMIFLGKREKIIHSGSIVMGLGLVFFGMGVMGDSMGPLQSYPPFLELMVRMETPILGILVGAIFTGLVQSSAATTGIAIVMASEGLVSLPAGIALAFGANIGTCVTAVLAAIGKPREAVRAAVVHILFNIAGVLLWVGFIDQLSEYIVGISPAHPELSGAARAAAEVPRQIANANTVFNIANTLIFLPFTGLIAKLVIRLVPDRPVEEKEIVSPRFLDASLLEAPSMALAAVRNELGHMGEILLGMWSRVGEAFVGRDAGSLDRFAEEDDQLDLLHDLILEYLQKIPGHQLTESQSGVFLELMASTDYLESMGDVLETQLVELGHAVIDRDLEISETMRLTLTSLGESVDKSMRAAIRAVRDDDQKAAQEVVHLKGEVDRRIDEVLRHQAAKLEVDDESRLAIFRLEMGLVDVFKRLHTLSKRIARTVLASGVGAREP